MKVALFVLLFSGSALACPSGAPSGFEAIPGQKERSYGDKAKTAVVVVKCDIRTNEEEMAKALALLGEVRSVRKGLAFVDVKPGAMRIYSTLNSKPVQVSIVAKNPESLEKASRAVVSYITKE